MSPLLDLQRRFRELGRIRLGEQKVSKNGKTYPSKLSEFRLTSASKELLDVAASVYGGTVREWEGAPTEGKQWELLTGTDRLDVLVPPGEPLSQDWELWSGGGCVRRCNGFAQTTGEACVCPSDLEERSILAKELKPRACKPVTRLSVILPRIPDIGVWRVETHGMNAAVELPGTVEILKKALDSGGLLPAQLRLEQRTSKKDGETRHFVVPVLELPTVTTAALMAGTAPMLHEIDAAAAPVAAISSGGIPAPAEAEAPQRETARTLPPLPDEIEGDVVFKPQGTITEPQKRYMRKLANQLGESVEDVIDGLSVNEAITIIDEMAEKVKALKS